MPRPGEVIGGRYRLENEIGSGAMGSVWVAEHVTLERKFAIKLISFEAARRPESVARFRREALIAVRIESDHVVDVIDHGEHDDLPYIVMEFLEGESLRERLKRLGRLSLAETAKVLRHVARALAAAHDLGLVHRDIKPENVFVTTVDGEEIYKVLDFGVAKVTDELSRDGVDPTKTGALLGTPYYLSPEQAQGLKTLDHRADLWSLAVVAFECATGKRPFEGAALGPLIAQIMLSDVPKPSERAPDADLPSALDEWMAKGLQRDPDARFASAREMAEAFAIASGVGESFDHGTAPTPTRRERPRSTKPEDLSNLDQTVALPEGADSLPTDTVALEESSLAKTAALPASPAHSQDLAPPDDRLATRDPILDKSCPTPPAVEEKSSWRLVVTALVVLAVLGALATYALTPR